MESRTIEYTDGDRTAELSDGVEVVFSGGEDSTDESGIEPDEWVDSLTWVSEPSASCPLDRRTFVGGIAEPPDF